MEATREKITSDYYVKKMEANTARLDKVRARLRVIPWLKVLFFLATVFFLIAAYQLGWDRVSCLIASAFAFVVFLLLYKPDEFYLRKQEYHLALNRVYTNEIAFLSGSSTKSMLTRTTWIFSGKTPFIT